MGHNLGDFNERTQRLIRKALNEVGSKPQNPVAKCPVRHEPLAKEKGKTGHTSRICVSITSYRRRLIDPDNLCGKYFLDAARYCGWIPDDTAGHIDYTIRQVKVSKKEPERTEIEIT